MTYKDSHIHLGLYDEIKTILKDSPFKNKYKVYSSINIDNIKHQEAYLDTLEDFFAIPIIFKETNIQEENKKIIKAINDYGKGIPVLLIDDNDKYNDAIGYLIMKEHFLLHKASNYPNRTRYYEYLNNNEGFLLLHCKDNIRIEYIQLLHKTFPKMNIIIAHLGRNIIENQPDILNVVNYFIHDEKVFFDISTISNIETIIKVIKIVGSDRILYGSDFPYEFNIDNENNKRCLLEERLPYSTLLKISGDNFEEIKTRILKKGI